MTPNASVDAASADLDRARRAVAAASRDLVIRASQLRRLSRRARTGGGLHPDLDEAIRHYESAAARALAAQRCLRALSGAERRLVSTQEAPGTTDSARGAWQPAALAALRSAIEGAPGEASVRSGARP